MSRFIQKSSSTLIALLALLSLLCAPCCAGAAAATHFFYFNPDSSLSNLAGLKQTMDTFLGAAGCSFSFQAFTRFRDFDRQVKEAHPSLVFLPEWYLKQDGNDRKFKPFLIPVRNNTTTYRKVLLVAAGSPLTKEKLPSVNMAMTPVGSAGMVMLNEVIFKDNGINPDRLNVITTAKDSDALFAVALDQVKAALVSEDNLRLIGAINPRILKAVRVLAVSQPISLPVLCYAEGAVASADLDKLRKSLLAGKNDKDTAQLMELLNIDAWQTPTIQ